MTSRQRWPLSCAMEALCVFGLFACSAGGSGTSGGGGSGGSSGTVNCAIGKGSPMVRVSVAAGAFCIDAHEATGTEYALFLLDAQRLPAQPSYCVWNGTYFPEQDVATVGDRAIGGVDFCDARAYCAWA